MSLFDFEIFRTSEELTPPELRGDKMLAWLRVLLRPLNDMADRFLTDYCKGGTYSEYDNSTAYTKGNRVIWQDDGVYELKADTSTGVKPTGNTLSSTNWLKILDNFIGANERMRYNGQLFVFEYAINKKFKITGAPYIYCTQIVPGVTQVFVEIKVPAAVYTALGPNNTARDNRIKEFAVQYTLGGIGIQVTSY